MQNAVIYARYSSDKQTEQSIEGQLRVCYEYAERLGLTVIHEYIDRAITGKYDDRASFQQMIGDAGKKQFQYIIVYKLDRFSRNRYDSAIYKTRLKKVGVKVLSAMEQLSDTPESMLLEAMLEAQAEYFSLDLAQKVRRGMRESALKANSIGGHVPIGYKYVDKKLVIDESTAPIPRIVFEMYAKGYGTKVIAEELNNKGFRKRTGKPFTLNDFRSMLKNRKYIGVYSYNDEIEIEGGCPALIDVDTFEAVQLKLEATKKAPAKAKAKVEYLLTTKLFCGYCKTSMVGESGRSRNGDVYYYYACRNKKRGGGCKKHNEKKDYLEWYVCEQTIDNVILNAEMIAEKVAALYEKEFGHNVIKEREKQVASLEREADNIVDVIAKTGNDRLVARLEKLEEQLNEAKLDLTRLKLSEGIKFTKEMVLSWIKSFAYGDLLDADYRKRVIEAFVNSVYLYDDKIVIFYNLKDSKQVCIMQPMSDDEKALYESLIGSDLTYLGEPK